MCIPMANIAVTDHQLNTEAHMACHGRIHASIRAETADVLQVTILRESSTRVTHEATRR